MNIAAFLPHPQAVVANRCNYLFPLIQIIHHRIPGNVNQRTTRHTLVLHGRYAFHA